MSTAAIAPTFTLAELHAIVRANIKDKSYLATRLGPVVQEYLAWKRHSRAAETTLDQIERDLARFALVVDPAGLEDVTVSELMLFLDLVPEGSWHRFRSHLNGFFKWARRYRPDNPCDLLPTLKRKTDAPVFPIFNLAEQQALINGCASSLLPDVDRARVQTILLGARKGGAIALTIGDFDLRDNVLLLREKGKKERLVDFGEELENSIRLLKLEPVPTLGRPLRDTDHLWFPWSLSKMHSTGERRLNEVHPERPMSKRGFHEWWAGKYGRVAAAGVAYRKPHNCRHTFATDLLDAGVNLYDVKDLLGHSSTRTTEVYIHSSRKRLKKARDLLAAYREENPEA